MGLELNLHNKVAPAVIWKTVFQLSFEQGRPDTLNSLLSIQIKIFNMIQRIGIKKQILDA